jgi:hypothetical protein
MAPADAPARAALLHADDLAHLSQTLGIVIADKTAQGAVTWHTPRAPVTSADRDTRDPHNDDDRDHDPNMTGLFACDGRLLTPTTVPLRRLQQTVANHITPDEARLLKLPELRALAQRLGVTLAPRMLKAHVLQVVSSALQHGSPAAE